MVFSATVDDATLKPTEKVKAAGCFPRWRCFTKGLDATRCFITVFPATLYDLKLFVTLTSPKISGNVETTCTMNSNNGTTNSKPCTLEDSPEQVMSLIESYMRKQALWETNCSHNKLKVSGNGKKEDCNGDSCNRKRIRVQSGGDSGPPSKKVSSCESLLDDAFRCRTRSVDNSWRTRHFTNARQLSADNGNATEELNPEGIPFGLKTDSFKFPDDYKLKYSNVTLPVFIFSPTLSILVDHVIFKTQAGGNDLSVDCRFKRRNNEEGSEDSGSHLASSRSSLSSEKSLNSSMDSTADESHLYSCKF